MPAQAPPTDAYDSSTVHLHVPLTGAELDLTADMLRERIAGEFELAEDLQALGRPVDAPVARAALCIRLAAAVAAAGLVV